MINAKEALERLIEGNKRFASDSHEPTMLTSQEKRSELVHGQAPFAVILGCSDSRVPLELVFDQGLGDLFVIRVAGNIVAPSQVGSIEYAVKECGSRLVVVLGHTNCGAVGATIQELKQPSENRSPNLAFIVEKIQPTVKTLMEIEPPQTDENVLRHSIRANVRASVAHLRSGSMIIENMVRSGELAVVGAEYSLETGMVDFFDGTPF
jgi:carbonic anhydrase